MNKRKGILTIFACAVIIAVAGGFMLWNQGAPAVNPAEYRPKAEAPEPGKELSKLQDDSAGVPGMILVAQNEALSLYYNEQTAEVSVMERESGEIWHSNPSDREEDAIASPFEKEVMASQFAVSFRDEIGTLETYWSNPWSVANNNFSAAGIRNGIRVTYTLGDVSLGIDAMPKYITKTRLQEKVLSKLEESLARYVETRYYPVKDNPELLERLDDQVKKPLVLKKMLAAFQEAGYTEEDLAADNEANGYGAGGGAEKPNFTVPLEYRLDGDSLVVSVPVGQVTESAKHRIRSIDLLRFFGAAGTKEAGYMLVPDGSGALIRLNNGKVKEEQYVQRVYGDDPNDNSWSRGQVARKATMPVYGMKAGDTAWFAVIEEGDAIASIAADISGKQNSYNYVFSSFAVRGEDELELYTGDQIQEIQLLSDKIYSGDLAVRYRFLTGEDASYSGMAQVYRESLVAQNKLNPLEEGTNLPFYLDVLGSIDKQKSALGVPYDAVISMTSFEEAGEMAQQLEGDGIANVRMRYLGWFGKGVHHKPPVKAKADRVLGSVTDLKELSARLKEQGGGLYPDVAFQRVYRDDGNFNPSSDAARFVTREVAELYPYDRNMNRMDPYYGTYNLLSPAKLPFYVDEFAKSYDKYGIGALSLRDLGAVLSSDYRVQRVVFREDAKSIVSDQLRKLSDSFPDLMVADASAYSWPYAKHVIDVPASSSRFSLSDEEIPFYQMVVHGFIDYAGEALNLGDQQEVRRQMLSSVELGTSPHFLWSYEPSSTLKFTRFDYMYSTEYQAWYDEAVSYYKEVNEVLGPLRNVPIAEHIRHREGVVEVRYEGGASVIINYTDQAVTINGVRVDAQHFAAGGDGA
ncbi:DUF5696 domain-containing protein [Paenibacillus vini]|uniref:DUF5696 domain-containing protein n=1 Tax=Paenibacillus vini TaxID=1476024 RepID=UPI0025B6F0D4|nr:DUF5696 domain-containing protein [Paenibacillus vini]MDN4070140.1 DUF5696 domain-containing protein [Paenibacillus vini]